MNIWDSVLLMTVIDFVVIIGFAVGFYLVYVKNNGLVRRQAKRGFNLLFLGLLAFVVFFLADLTSMHLLPLFVPMETAMALMKDIILNYNWVILPLGVLLMIVGTAQVIQKYAAVISDLKASQTKLSNELEKRTKAEKGLAEAQKMARLGNWEWDMVTNKLVWSDELYNICKIDPKKFKKTYPAFMAIIPTEDRMKVQKIIDDAIYNGMPFDVVHRIMLPNKDLIQVHQRGEIIRDDQNQPISMVGTLQDVTKQKELEGKARQAYRIKTISQLAGGVAHDFNNLLAVVYGNLGLLKQALTNEKKIDRKEALSLTSNSLEAAKSCSSLVKRLLAFSRQQNLAPKKFAVNDKLDNMMEFLTRSIGETITVELDTAKQNLMIDVDPGQFETSILNLALNARDAMANGGRLTIRTEAMKVKVMGNATEDLETGDYVLISIVDTGEGMSKDVQEHVLEPFFTTKDVGEGSGLGLSSVFGFVKQSKGHLTINSEKGKGTIVQIYLPRVDATIQRKPAPVKRALKPFEISGKVLVVEDNPKVRKVVAETVKKLGFETRMAANAREAFHIIETEDDITFLLSDIVMPGGMLGTELAIKAREMKPSLPILLMSGYADYISGEDRPSIKGINILQKPFTPQDLAEQITMTCQKFGERVPNAFKNL